MRYVLKRSIVATLGLVALAASARADFLLTSGNAAFNPSITSPAWGASLTNTTRPYQWNTSGSVTSAEASIFTDAPGAFTASSLGSSPIRSYRWGFRNAGGSNGGTAGKGLSGTAGGLSAYTQAFTAGSNTGTITWVDAYENSRSRIDASITYTLTDGAGAGAALVAVSASFTNHAATTETYDFFNLVDSQILGLGGGSNDAVSASVLGSASIISFSDTVSGNPYTVNFIAQSPSFWEVNIPSTINTKTFSGAGNPPTSYSGVGGSTAGVINGTGDRFGAFQWRATLAPGASVTYTSYIGINSVPEPATFALLGLGALAIRRRR